MCRNNLDRIENLVNLHPRGLNITEIAQKTTISRLTAARYLDVLTAEGRLELRVVGKSKMYYRSRNIPGHGLLQHTPQVQLIVDISFCIVACSEAVAGITGLSAEKIVNTPILDLNSPLVRQIIPLLDSSIIGSVVTEITLSDAAKTLYYEVNITPVEISEGSRGWKIVIRDITGVAELGLAGTGNIYRTLIEQIGETLISFDDSGTITTNRQIRPTTEGYADNELMNRNIHDFLVMDPDGTSPLSTATPSFSGGLLQTNRPVPAGSG